MPPGGKAWLRDLIYSFAYMGYLQSIDSALYVIVCLYSEDGVSVSHWQWDYLQSSRFCRVFQGVLVFFKRHTVDAVFPLSLAPQRPVFSVTHMPTYTHKHWRLPPGPIIVPIGTPWRPITTTGDTKKTSFILLSCYPPLSLWVDFSSYVALFPVIRPFLPLPPVCDISFPLSIAFSPCRSSSPTPVVLLALQGQT